MFRLFSLSCIRQENARDLKRYFSHQRQSEKGTQSIISAKFKFFCMSVSSLGNHVKKGLIKSPRKFKKVIFVRMRFCVGSIVLDGYITSDSGLGF